MVVTICTLPSAAKEEAAAPCACVCGAGLPQAVRTPTAVQQAKKAERMRFNIKDLRLFVVMASGTAGGSFCAGAAGFAYAVKYGARWIECKPMRAEHMLGNIFQNMTV